MQKETPSNPPASNNTSPSRRRFLATGAAVTAASTFASRMVHGQSNDQKIRVGLIGCGGRGRGAAKNAMNAGPDVQIVALADLFQKQIDSAAASLSARADQFDVPAERQFSGFDCHQQLIDRGDVDVVLLASPPHYRPMQVESAVAAGKHIFCEKPIATDVSGVHRVMEACKLADEKGLNIVSGLCWRYDTGVKAIMKRVHDGEIGDVLSAQSNYLTGPVWIRPRQEGDTEMQYQCRNWYNFTWLSGDHIVEQFIHGLDKLMWLHHDEPPVKAYGMGGRQRRSDVTQGDIYDHFSVVYEWQDGTRAHAYTRQIRGCMNQTDEYFYGTKGKAVILSGRIEGENAWQFDKKEKEGNMYDLEHRELFKAIRGDRERINNGKYMCQSTLLAIIGREVCYSGREITWKDAMASQQNLAPLEYSFEAEAPVVEVKQPGKYRFA